MRCSSPCTSLYFSSSPPETFATLHLPRPDFQPTKQPNHNTVRILFHTKFNASSNCSRLNLVYFIYPGRTFPLPCRIHYKHFPNILRILELLVTISKDAAEFFTRRKSYCQWWPLDQALNRSMIFGNAMSTPPKRLDCMTYRSMR